MSTKAATDGGRDAIVSALVQALEGGQVVVFAGAGVSISPPAGLPNWLKLRDWTLEAVANRATFLAPHLATLTNLDMLASPGQKGMTPELVASEIADQCSGYFESLRVLDDGGPNANHQAIARLARAGRLRAVVTTNFDVFLERALTDENVEFDLYRGQDEFARFPLGGEGPQRLSVLKIHGCLTRPDTIIATVESQARGLAEHQLFVMRWLQERCPFLYWGYSGWDLKINLDYLGTVTAAERAPGFFWSLHRDSGYTESPSPYILELTRLYEPRGIVDHAIAPEASARSLRAAGYSEPTPLAYTPEQLATWRQAKDATLRQRLSAWAATSVSDDAAILIFGALLQVAGRHDDALSCFQDVERIAIDRGEVPLQAVASLRTGHVFMARGGFLRALESYRRAEELARQLEDGRTLAVALNSIGRALTRLARLDEALASFREASRRAATNDDPMLLGALTDSIGEIHVHRNQFEDALTFFQRAEAAYRRAGAKRLLSGCLNKQGTIHRTWQDWERAGHCFREALTIARDVVGDADGVDQARLFIASLDAVQGHLDAAWRELTALEAIARRNKSTDLLLKTMPYLILVESNRGNRERADEIEDEQIQLLRQQGQTIALGRALTTQAHRVLAIHGPGPALAQCNEALDLLTRAGDTLGTALVHERKGLIHQDLNQPVEAVACFLSSISSHRNVDQNPRQFVPALLERIAVCGRQTIPSAEDVIATAIAHEPLLAEVARDLEDPGSRSAMHQIYDLAGATQRLAHQHKDDRELCIRYLRAALELATAIGYVHQIANLHADIGWMHVVGDEFEQALPLLRTAVEMSHAIDDTESEILHVGNLGFGFARSGEDREGFAVLDRATSMARSAGHRERLLWLLREQGGWYKERRDPRALPFLEEAIVLAEEMGDLSLAADLSFDAGKVYRDTRQFERAFEYRLRGVHLLDLLGQPSFERLVVIANLLENDLDRPAEAVPFYERGLALCARDPALCRQVLEMLHRAVNKQSPGTTLPTPVFDALASRYKSEEQAGQVVSAWARSVGFEMLASQPMIASRVLTHGKSTLRATGEAVLAYARSLMESRQLPSAAAELEEAERIAISLGDREWFATVRRSQADSLRAAGRPSEALQAYAEAERIAALTGNPAEIELLRYAMADIAFEQGALDVALDHIEGALAAAREAQYPAGIAHDLLKLADILTARGDLDRAERTLAEAIPIFHGQRIVSQWIESTVKRADLLLQMDRREQALEAYRSVEPVIQRGGSPLARRRLEEGIERAARGV